MKAFLFSCTLLLLAGCDDTAVTAYKPPTSEQAQRSQDMLVGKWFGEFPTTDNRIREILMDRHSDGKYVVTFKICDLSGKCETQQEAGLWGVSGDIYFTNFLGYVTEKGVVPVPPSAYNNDAYRILKLTKDNFVYKHAENGNQYDMKKVSEDFTF